MGNYPFCCGIDVVSATVHLRQRRTVVSLLDDLIVITTLNGSGAVMKVGVASVVPVRALLLLPCRTKMKREWWRHDTRGSRIYLVDWNLMIELLISETNKSHENSKTTLTTKSSQNLGLSYISNINGNNTKNPAVYQLLGVFKQLVSTMWSGLKNTIPLTHIELWGLKHKIGLCLGGLFYEVSNSDGPPMKI